MSESPRDRIVVGVADGQADAVLLVAAEFAARLGAALVCVVVDEAHHAVTGPGGRTVLAPIDPDSSDDAPAGLSPHAAALLERLGVPWTARVVTGEPSAGLAEVAAASSALMIVIGTRRRSVSRGLREFFAGSIAAHLAHRQPRPILVVPLDPAPADDGLPWHEAEE